MLTKVISQNITYNNISNNKKVKQNNYSPKGLSYDTFVSTKPKNINFKGREVETMIKTYGQTELDWYYPGRAEWAAIVKTDDINILGGDQANLVDMAENFYSYKEADLRNFCTQWKKSFLGIDYEDIQASEKAYNKLLPEIEKVRKKVENLSLRKQELEDKQLNGGLDLTEQKRMLALEFIKPVNLSDQGIDAEVPNGILLYGDSELNREQMYDWIKEKSDFIVKDAIFDSENPDESLKSLVGILEDAQVVHEATGVRTLVNLGDYDELLTNPNTPANRRAIARFKNLAETVAKKYHSTFILKTAKPIKSFEAASIGAQRFNIVFDLSKIDLSDDELKELEDITKELDRLKDKTESAPRRFRVLTQLTLPSDDDKYLTKDEFYRKYY